jgi:hypothetical protein
VLVPQGRGYQRRPIAIGRVFSGFATVLSGLREGEALVAQRPVLVEAERRP